MRTLLVAPAWVGDMVMMEPLVRRLHARAPAGEIHVAAPAATLPVASRMAHVAGTLDWPFGHGSLDLGGRLRLARAWRGLGFTQAIVLPNSWKSALVPFLARIPRRTGFVGEQRYGLLNDARRLDATALPSMVQRFLMLADAAGEPPPAREAPQLQADMGNAAALRAQFGLHDARPVLALCAGAEYGDAKRWPAVHYAALADAYLARGWQVWLFGSPKDVAMTRDIDAGVQRREAGPVVDLAGRTKLVDAIDLLACADAVASNDSGLMHVAAALGRPVLGIFGSTSDTFTPPLGPRTRTVGIELPCRPCFARTCRFGHYDCLRKLSPSRVQRALDGLLDVAP
jgi:heptosyltransferase-2